MLVKWVVGDVWFLLCGVYFDWLCWLVWYYCWWFVGRGVLSCRFFVCSCDGSWFWNCLSSSSWMICFSYCWSVCSIWWGCVNWFVGLGIVGRFFCRNLGCICLGCSDWFGLVWWRSCSFFFLVCVLLLVFYLVFWVGVLVYCLLCWWCRGCVMIWCWWCVVLYLLRWLFLGMLLFLVLVVFFSFFVFGYV